MPAQDKVFQIGGATMAQCRSDVPNWVLPPGDTRICFGNDAIQSNHLLTATAAQNYGSNSYRIRQPFDFANRTGSIVFDADATANRLMGWIAIAVTEDPMPSPSFSASPGAGNFEGGVIPKNGLTVELDGSCSPTDTKVTMIHEYRNYVDNMRDLLDGPNASSATCFPVSHHRLNRFELKLSQTRVELWATPVSADGVNFAAPTRVASANISLNFTRGYVHLITRNHASSKYWNSSFPADGRDAWLVRWDNIGFDGPVINNTREFEVPDALVPASDLVALGYTLADVSNALKKTVTIKGVQNAGQAVRARLALNAYYSPNFSLVGLPTWGLVYRLNGKTWHTYDLSPAEEALLSSGVTMQGDRAGQANPLIIGVLAHVIDVPVSELVEGDNVLEVASLSVPIAGAPPAISNIDLVLTYP